MNSTVAERARKFREHLCESPAGMDALAGRLRVNWWGRMEDKHGLAPTVDDLDTRLAGNLRRRLKAIVDRLGATQDQGQAVLEFVLYGREDLPSLKSPVEQIDRDAANGALDRARGVLLRFTRSVRSGQEEMDETLRELCLALQRRDIWEVWGITYQGRRPGSAS